MSGYDWFFIGWNLFVFFLYGWDKRCAIAKKRRVPENLLLIAAFLGGGIGGVMGMIVWHHKTSKIRFRMLIPCSFLLTLTLIRYF